MAKKTGCKKKCKAQETTKNCDGDSCPINLNNKVKVKKNNIVSTAIQSWNNVIDACKSIVDKRTK